MEKKYIIRQLIASGKVEIKTDLELAHEYNQSLIKVTRYNLD